MRLDRPSGWLTALLLVVLCLTCPRPAAAAPVFPPLSGRVVDQANVLSPSIEAGLDAKLAALEAKTSRQLVVITIPSLQGLEIEDYGYQLGRAWGIGEKKKDTGVLLIVAPSERRVRIEVGYGLEGVLTDAVSNVILQEKVLPKFRAGDISGGIVDGAEAVIIQLTLPDDEAKARVAAVADGSGKETEDLPLILVGFLVIWVVFGLLGSVGGRPGHRAQAWLWPLIFLARSSSGFGGGGRSGGGGFSGGGGSFGGGGASGRW